MDDDTWTSKRSRLISLKRHRSPDDPAIAEAARDLALARVAEKIRAAVADAPPLPSDVSARLVELIRATPAADNRAAA